MKLRLNLSTAPQDNRRPFVAGAALLGAIAVIALLLLAKAAYTSWQSNRAVHSQVAAFQDEISRSSASQAALEAYFQTPNARKILDRASFLNSLIGARSFPWTDIFTALEETLPAGVRVVKIEPKLVNGRAELSLTIAAVNDEQSIRFLQAMEKSKVFSDVQVESEKREENTTTQDHITLQLKVVYETI